MISKVILLLLEGLLSQSKSIPLQYPTIRTLSDKFVSTSPDLPERIRNGWPFTPYNRATFYAPGPEGYIDYAVYGKRGHGEEAAEKKALEAAKEKL